MHLQVDKNRSILLYHRTFTCLWIVAKFLNYLCHSVGSAYELIVKNPLLVGD